MSKTKTAETIEFPSFDTSKAAEQMRTFAEKGAEQSKEAYAKMKIGAEDAQKVLRDTYETAKTVSNDMSLKTIAALRVNAEANFSHLEQLVAAKSLSEVFELQTAFLRKRVELAVDQAKEFHAASSKAAEEIGQPLKAAFEKAVHKAA